ncbi:MAG: hypothetical protein MUC95_04015 [Spirochaetes bacterium]|nr:hypothetical protein [Spirochaetota bacterium]
MIILFFIQLTIAINIYLLFQLILKSEKKIKRWFVLLLLGNIYFILTAMGLYIFLPSLFDDFDSTLNLWLVSGLITALTLSTKIQILKTITKRIREQRIREKQIKDQTSAQDAEKKALAERLLAERQKLYRQIPYRHFRNKEIKRQEEEERRSGKSKSKNILELATSNEMVVFLATIPFFLLSSGYFFAKLIHYLVFHEY